MPLSPLEPITSLAGLTTDEVNVSRSRNGANALPEPEHRWQLLVDIVTEPMFGLLAGACTLYGFLGEWQEGIVLGIAMLLVAGLSVFESIRSDKALQALRQLTQPTVQAMRDGQLTDLPTAELVVGDVVLLTEGQTVPADGRLLQANDCTVDESMLTGESVPVTKIEDGTRLYSGTVLTSGRIFLWITAVGEQTELGQLGRSLQTIVAEKTPLQQQIHHFVNRMAFVGLGAFLLVCLINFARSGDWVTSLLFGLTMAMTILPEEIPVAFSSFMALGAARMARFGVLTKQPQTVESLGSASVICVDKTGTITQEGMILTHIYANGETTLIAADNESSLPTGAHEVLSYARWASESEPFDPMEKAILTAYMAHSAPTDAGQRPMVHEYPLSGSPPMMTHVYDLTTGNAQIAGKGAVERIVQICRLASSEAKTILETARLLSAKGYRVLGVAGSHWSEATYPASQDDFPWTFKGLIAFENPPKPNAGWVIDQFKQAGITVKLITGDAPETALAIARQVGLDEGIAWLTGEQVMALSDRELRKKVDRINVFARMLPQAKLRVVEALKANKQVVAMTGDGVNDGPALKAAHIGVAMGQRGTELARRAASLILTNDDLGSMVDAIALGRRIDQNLKNAIAYIVAIHIPIILIVTLPLIANWQYINLLNPIHVIILELIMGPTCSIAFEQEPAGAGLMQQPPRPLNATFFSSRELTLSLIQGLAITLTTLGIYYVTMQLGYSANLVRTLTFTNLVMSNIWLTFIRRSNQEPLLRSIQRPNPVLWAVVGVTVVMLAAAQGIPGIRDLMQFTPLTVAQWGQCCLLSLAGTLWVEGYNAWQRRPKGLGR
ncbi:MULTISPECIES: cation-translocating P-type ATPase [unclassified Spirosoma]|uniref:cation-translocating P-type ATPase n=1 Tax=unclassified Spirosoma TaxID=2621999 RepID=UPI0009601E65|nr:MULTISPECIES: cation-translocating P-type ATPase [unclassified Spirosoma]OJW76144.1 MAG: haloacid dehalogenase [Spirosoma sp. 48-14]